MTSASRPAAICNAATFRAAAGQGQAWIARRVPHQGRMCLLDSVLHASPGGLQCQANSHRDPHNPLRQQGRLGAACGVEYAGQAMALHGALLAEAQGQPPPARGMLVSLRGLNLHATRLDNVAAPLHIQVSLEADNGNASLYRFALFDANAPAHPLLDGRALVRLEFAA